MKRAVFCRVKNTRSLHRTFNVEPLYLQHENTGTLREGFMKKKSYYTNPDNDIDVSCVS